MNCTNCGAPLAPVAGRDYFRCDHCETIHFAAAPEDSLDRVVTLEGLSGDDCPVCQEPLGAGALEGVCVGYCPSCRGILLSHETFGHVVGKRRREYDGPDITPAPRDPVQLERRIACPRCSRAMETHSYYGPGNSVIDTCAACSLVFVDCGEIAAIEQAPGRR